jgi:hypothetical protein
MRYAHGGAPLRLLVANAPDLNNIKGMSLNLTDDEIHGLID